MKFIIEPINDTDCRIVDIDCSDMQCQAVSELTIPATVEQDGKTYRVKEVGKLTYNETRRDFWGNEETMLIVPNGCCFVGPTNDASLTKLADGQFRLDAGRATISLMDAQW